MALILRAEVEREEEKKKTSPPSLLSIPRLGLWVALTHRVGGSVTLGRRFPHLLVTESLSVSMDLGGIILCK